MRHKTRLRKLSINTMKAAVFTLSILGYVILWSFAEASERENGMSSSSESYKKLAKEFNELKDKIFGEENFKKEEIDNINYFLSNTSSFLSTQSSETLNLWKSFLEDYEHTQEMYESYSRIGNSASREIQKTIIRLYKIRDIDTEFKLARTLILNDLKIIESISKWTSLFELKKAVKLWKNILSLEKIYGFGIFYEPNMKPFHNLGNVDMDVENKKIKQRNAKFEEFQKKYLPIYKQLNNLIKNHSNDDKKISNKLSLLNKEIKNLLHILELENQEILNKFKNVIPEH